jgi:hypothetical protein
MTGECPVCLDARAFDEEGGLEGIGCARRHGICIKCACELAYFADCACDDKSTCSCSGFVYKCPMCRGQVKLQRRHLLVMLKGSWERAGESAMRQSPPEVPTSRFGRIVPVVAGC